MCITELWRKEVERQQKRVIRSEIPGKAQKDMRFEQGGRGERYDMSQCRAVQQSECQEEKLLSCFVLTLAELEPQLKQMS